MRSRELAMDWQDGMGWDGMEWDGGIWDGVGGGGGCVMYLTNPVAPSNRDVWRGVG